MALDYVNYVQANEIYKALIESRDTVANDLAVAAGTSNDKARDLGVQWLLLNELITAIEEDEKRSLMLPHQRLVKA
ncbi:hypothetical protein AAULR_24191 [Lacticaseibacillus rhamnosus MTCC 5462]|nr:hypothetical protein AAULR_24191 [Lacticaseibacillus rhamnosus MTCC 5462]